MRIDAITTCVGPTYAAHLARSLRRWDETLESITVVTKPGDRVAEWLGNIPGSLLCGRLRVVTTDVFTEHGASFNKGAALNVAYDQASPSDWVLHFDADVQPPENWRWIVEQQARPGYLHGCQRFSVDASGWRARTKHPLGFFQLWHTSDPCAWRWPLFPPCYPCAGGYDAEFAEYWPRDRWRELPLTLQHFGSSGVNWFGEGSTRQTLEWRARRGRFGNERLPVDVKQIILNPDSEPEYAAGILRECRQAGPFGKEAAPA